MEKYRWKSAIVINLEIALIIYLFSQMKNFPEKSPLTKKLKSQSKILCKSFFDTAHL